MGFVEALTMNADSYLPHGYTARTFRGPDDYPVLADLLNASEAANSSEYVTSVEDLAHNYSHVQRCDLRTDLLLVHDPAGEPAAYTRVFWDQELDGLRRYGFVCNILPEHRGVLTAGMLDWIETRIRAIAADQGYASERVYQTWCENEAGMGWMIDQLRARGYAVTRYGYMMLRDLAEPIPADDLPDGFNTRHCERADLRAIWDAMDEAFRDHWGFREQTEADFERWSTEPELDPTLWQVAWAGDEVAGMVLNFVPREENERLGLSRGWTDPICVRRPWRRKGVARALILRSLRMFRKLGYKEAALGVDTQNPNGALQLYESCGFRPYRRSVTLRRALVLEPQPEAA